MPDLQNINKNKALPQWLTWKRNYKAPPNSYRVNEYDSFIGDTTVDLRLLCFSLFLFCLLNVFYGLYQSFLLPSTFLCIQWSPGAESSPISFLCQWCCGSWPNQWWKQWNVNQRGEVKKDVKDEAEVDYYNQWIVSSVGWIYSLNKLNSKLSF